MKLTYERAKEVLAAMGYELQASEPVGYIHFGKTYPTKQWKSDPPYYTTPQPAPCPRCAELEKERRESINTYAANILALTASWEAKCAELEKQLRISEDASIQWATDYAFGNVLLDECEKALTHMFEHHPLASHHRVVSGALAKLKNRGA